MKKALFVILDTALIKTLSGKDYSIHRNDWKFINQTVLCIKDYTLKDYKICIIANQPQITQGLVSEKVFNYKLETILGTLERDLKLPNNSIASSYCKDKYNYRYLPNPGMIYELALEFDLDVVNSTLLGNSIYDKEIIQYTGIKNYLSVLDLIYPM